MKNNDLSALPQIETILQDESIREYFPSLSRPIVTEIARNIVNEARKTAVQSGDSVPDAEVIIHRVAEKCRIRARDGLQQVVNATGIVLHTNMGRSPLPPEAWKAVESINCGYSNLELDLASGKRGKRKGLIPELLSFLTGAEDALIVNNNAAAVFLLLSTFAKGKEVIVSRGEQVQIGGGFRVPEILAASGAHLVEIGTTNITTIDDYTSAFSEQTALILSVHRSNFAIRGFTKAPSLAELGAVKPSGVLLCVDQGSGVTTETVPGEVSAQAHLRDGADLVCFSGDKVLGGPQSGILAGKQHLIKRLETHPLMRVFRPGKTIYSLLEQSLIMKLNGYTGRVEATFSRDEKELRKTARRILSGVPKEAAEIVPSTCSVGGGSSPDETIPSLSIRLHGNESAEKTLKKLRSLRPPIIATISDNLVHLNLGAVREADIPYLRERLRVLFGGAS